LFLQSCLWQSLLLTLFTWGRVPPLPSRLERFWHERHRRRPARARGVLAGARFFIGFSYALGASFAAWALIRCISFRQARVAAVGAAAGGITLVGVLMAGGCFLIGCCGSPMLAVYVSLFGSRALGVGKPLTALVTLVSVGCGYWCLSRRLTHGGVCCSSTGAPQKTNRTGRSKVGPTTRAESHDRMLFR
jgi:hypothetical protein